MAESSTEQSAPEDRPENTDTANDTRNDEVEGDESAPLISSDNNDNQEAPRTQPYIAPKSLFVLTSIALSSSVLTLIFLIAAMLMLALARGQYDLPYSVQDSMAAIAAPVRNRLFVRSFVSSNLL